MTSSNNVELRLVINLPLDDGTRERIVAAMKTAVAAELAKVDFRPSFTPISAEEGPEEVKVMFGPWPWPWFGFYIE